jgi:hypothetical protein
MTRAAWLFSRHPFAERDRRLLETVGQRWRPRAVEAFVVDVVVDGEASAAAVFGGVTVSGHDGVSAVLDSPGAAVGAVGDAIAADASAVVRVSSDVVEVVVAVPARRTLWSFFDGDRLLISTSQRAMAVLLGGFSPSHEAATWMLSAGNLGPCAWDRRVHRLDGGTRLRLDRRAWSLTTTLDPPPSAPAAGRATAAQLRGAIASALLALPNSSEGWCLPLSGGVDSRALASMLVGQGRRPRCVTWASPTLASFPDGDLAVARRVGSALGLQVDEELMTPVDVDEAITAFVEESEGRVDHVGGYLDGFGLWGRLATRGTHAIVRGDEVMGWVSVADERDVLRSIEATRLGDLDGVDAAVAGEGAQQTLPTSLQRGPSESLPTWRDRLYRGYRVPAVVGALADAKAAFVDTWSPLLSRKVVSVALGLSDDDRTDKRLFRRVAKPSALGLPYAAQASVVGSGAVLNSPAFAAFARPLFEEGVSRNVLPRSWSALGAKGLALAAARPAAVPPSSMVQTTTATPRAIAKQLGRRLTPVALRKALWRRRHGVRLPMEKVPLRLVLIVLANALLRDDGAAGAKVPQ